MVLRCIRGLPWPNVWHSGGPGTLPTTLRIVKLMLAKLQCRGS